MLSNPGLLFCILSSDNFKLSRSKSRQQRKPWRRSYKTFPMKQFFRASIGLLYKKKTQKEVYKVDIRPVNHRPYRTTGSKKLIYMIGNRGGL